MADVLVRNAAEGGVVVAGRLLLPGETAFVDEGIAAALNAERGEGTLVVVRPAETEPTEELPKPSKPPKGGKAKGAEENQGGQGAKDDGKQEPGDEGGEAGKPAAIDGDK